MWKIWYRFARMYRFNKIIDVKIQRIYIHKYLFNVGWLSVWLKYIYNTQHNPQMAGVFLPDCVCLCAFCCKYKNTIVR